MWGGINGGAVIDGGAGLLLEAEADACGRGRRELLRGTTGVRGSLRRIVLRSKTQLDEGAGVRGQLGLPAVVALQLLHGGFACGIPAASGLSGEVAGLDQRGLDLGGALRLHGTRAGGLRGTA